jgi:transcriptional regulator with XRE-family HTH domain
MDGMILDDRFRTKVEEALKYHGWTQSELARRMGVGRQYISQYLRQGISPRTETIEKFAEALHVDPGNLVDKNPLEILSMVH